MDEGGKENEGDDVADDAWDEMITAVAEKEGRGLRTAFQRRRTSKRQRWEKMLKRRHMMKQ